MVPRYFWDHGAKCRQRSKRWNLLVLNELWTILYISKSVQYLLFFDFNVVKRGRYTGWIDPSLLNMYSEFNLKTTQMLKIFLQDTCKWWCGLHPETKRFEVSTSRKTIQKFFTTQPAKHPDFQILRSVLKSGYLQTNSTKKLLEMDTFKGENLYTNSYNITYNDWIRPRLYIYIRF